MRRADIALTLALLFGAGTVATLQGCATTAPGPTTTDSQLAVYTQRLEVATAAYNGIVDAYTIAAATGLIDDQQRDLIDPYGEAAHRSLVAAGAALEAWAVSTTPGNAERLGAALAGLSDAIIRLGAQWRVIKP